MIKHQAETKTDLNVDPAGSQMEWDWIKEEAFYTQLLLSSLTAVDNV